MVLCETYYLIKLDDYGFIGNWDKNILMPQSYSNRIKSNKHEYKQN